MTSLRTSSCLLLLVVLATPGHALEGASTTQPVPAEFVDYVNYYAALQRMAIAELGPPLMCSDAEQLLRQQRRIANAMRAARPVAHAGDFFTPAVSRYFRARVEAVVWDTGLDVTMSIEAPDEGEVVMTPVLRVWKAVPWNTGPVMWPSMLRALPELPPDLEYRFIGRDLVLIDVLANLVVDVLHNALPEPESSSS
jgi:hypothetical protein